MSWFGKILGGGIGMAMGGPLGAILGAGLGHTLLDQNAGAGPRMPRLSPQETRQTVFFTATFAMLGKMAKADGAVSPEEIQVVERFMSERMGLDTRTRRLAIRIFDQGKAGAVPFTAYADQFGQVFAGEYEMRVMLFELLYSLAVADGALHPAEDRLLREALGPLRLDPGVYEKIREAVPDLQKQYAVLGCAADATDEEVKKAYRKACREFHPDTVVSKGLPEEFVKFAETKFKEINAAYEAIREHRKTAS